MSTTNLGGHQLLSILLVHPSRWALLDVRTTNKLELISLQSLIGISVNHCCDGSIVLCSTFALDYAIPSLHVPYMCVEFNEGVHTWQRERERESVGIQLRPPFNVAYVLFLYCGTSSLVVRLSFLLVFRRSWAPSCTVPMDSLFWHHYYKHSQWISVIISQLHIATQIETQ